MSFSLRTFFGFEQHVITIPVVKLDELLTSFEHCSIDMAPTVIMEMANGKATKEQIIIRVLLVQLSMAFFRKFQ